MHRSKFEAKPASPTDEGRSVVTCLQILIQRRVRSPCTGNPKLTPPHLLRFFPPRPVARTCAEDGLMARA